MNRNLRRSALAAALCLISLSASAVDVAVVQIIGLKASVGPYVLSPAVAPLPGPDQPSYDPADFDPTINPAVPPLPNLSGTMGCVGYLEDFIDNPEYVQPAIDFANCAKVEAPAALLSFMAGLPGVLGSGTSDDVSEITGYAADMSDYAVAEARYLRLYPDSLVQYVQDGVISGVGVSTRASLISCTLAISAYDAGGTNRVGYGAATRCTDGATFPGTSFSLPVSITASTEVRDLVSGALLSTGAATSEMLLYPYAHSEARKGTVQLALNSAAKVKHVTSITPSFPSCAPGAAACKVAWVVIPNKSVSTATRFVCAEAGASLNCELDSPPLKTGLGPETYSVGLANLLP